MKETITNKEMWDYIHQYYGYGCVDAPVYLIGQEEGGGNIDYRYDRFINAEEGTFIDTPNPIDPNKTIRTLDGSAFHKVIRRLEKKDDLVKEIVTNLGIAINNRITKYIDYNNESDKALTTEIDNLYQIIKKELLDFLLDEKRFITPLTDTSWLYSYNSSNPDNTFKSEMRQDTFTPLVDYLISPIYSILLAHKAPTNNTLQKNEFQAKYMSRIIPSSPYKIFVSELYPLAAKSLSNWNEIKNFCPDFNKPFGSPKKKNYVKSNYRHDCIQERVNIFKYLITNNCPKFVIMYGGIGDKNGDFNPYWNEISGEEVKWDTYKCKKSFFIKDTGKTIFIKIEHPTAHNINTNNYEYLKTVLSTIEKFYLNKHNESFYQY